MKDKERFWVRGPGEGGGRIEGVGIGRVRCKKGRVSEKARERELLLTNITKKLGVKKT